MNKLVLLRMLQHIILLPLHLFMCLTCWILSPVLPLFAINKETLPKWLSWYQTPDASLDGDSGHVERCVGYPQYVQRVLWLIRNPAYGFAWSVLAYQPKTPEFKWKGSIGYTNGDESKFGWYFITQESGHFQYSVRYPSVFEKQFRLRFGWKMIGIATAGTWHERKKFVFTLNPLDGG